MTTPPASRVPPILLVDDQPEVLDSLAIDLEQLGADAVLTARTAAEGEAILGAHPEIEIVGMDQVMPGGSGTEAFKRMCARGQHTGRFFVLATAYAPLEEALEAVADGHVDEVLGKPVRGEDLLIKHRLWRPRAPVGAGRSKRPAGFIGDSARAVELLRQVERAAAVDHPVLIIGETGTGKELVAKTIHSAGPRRDKPFVAVNCAALPEGVLESELFGHRKGAFSGAIDTRAGRIRQAHGGTFLLDEIGDLKLELQGHLLRVLQERVVSPVGTDEDVKVDVRFLAATHRDLEDMVRRGQFRRDLYFRLSVLQVRVPSLAERADDVPQLAEHFLNEHHAEQPLRLTERAAVRLRGVDWQGNIRDLQGVMTRVRLAAGDRKTLVGVEDVVAALGPLAITQNDRDPSPEELRRALRAARGVVATAAELLGIPRRTFYRQLHRQGVSPEEARGMR